jgi:FkbM family methyltransferase
MFCPAFVLRPDIFARACGRKAFRLPKTRVVHTAWGDALEVAPAEFIGKSIYFRGAHELPVCETLWRLVESGNRVADVGANIGVMTSVLSRKVGIQGEVFAFEPHPKLGQRLRQNVSRWPGRRVQVFQQAVSNRTGPMWLAETDTFAENEGTARIDLGSGNARFEIKAVRLDDILDGKRVQLIKIDVEGHELEALSGARRLLASGETRHVVFEAGWNYPSPAHELLLDLGFEVFELNETLLGPQLTEPKKRRDGDGKTLDYLATRDAALATALLRPKGWLVLHHREPTPRMGR